MTTDEPILCEILSDLAVAVITLNRPQTLNALSDALMGALDDELTSLESDDAVRCVVLRGSGRAFAAGADVSAMAEEGAAELLAGGQLDRWERVRRFEKPLIAAVHGFCLGGGCELAESCDIVIAAEDARFGLPEVSLGIIPGAGGTQLTPRAVGKSLAMEMVLAGRFLSADEALAHGLCSRVVAHEALRDEAVALATAIASRPALAVRLAKRADRRVVRDIARGRRRARAGGVLRRVRERGCARGHRGVRREAPAEVEGALSMADGPEVVVERVGAVVTLRLNRPEQSNALTRSARAELARALRDAGRDADVRCVVLAGAGRNFCAGQDLREEGGLDDVAGVIRDGYAPIVRGIAELPKPVVAAVNGAAAGAGAALALACDIRVFADDAFVIMAFSNIGLVPDAGASWFLADQVGYQRAFEMCATGRRVPAHEALTHGLCERVVLAGDLAKDAASLAERLAERPPLALAWTKRLLRRSLTAGLDEILELEAQLQRAAVATADHREGVDAFLEKRVPRFEGR